MHYKNVGAILQFQIDYYKNLQKFFEEKLTKLEPSITNTSYLKALSKLIAIDHRLEGLKLRLNQIKKANRFHRRFIVAVNSRVKLVSTEVGAVLWVDAKNLSELIGRRVGEIVFLYNSQFQIAGVY